MGRKRNSSKTIEGIIYLIILAFAASVLMAVFQWIKAAVNSTINSFVKTIKSIVENPYLDFGLILIAGLIFGTLAFLLIKKTHTEKQGQRDKRVEEYLFKKGLIKEQQAESPKQVKKPKKEELHKKPHNVSISDDRHDYKISKKDYKRGNKVDNEYRKKYFLTLLHHYKNKCGKCGDMQNGVDLDHFIFSKNDGGNFALLHKDGHLINNAIPLCKSCNRSKGDRSYKIFFTKEEALDLFTINNEMTTLINSEKQFLQLIHLQHNDS